MYNIINIYDSISITDTLIIDVTITSNINALSTMIKLYPNPTKDLIYIDFQDYKLLEGCKIEVVDLQSHTIYSEDIITNLTSIDISEFGAEGLYIIQILDSNSNIISTKKILLN